MSPASRLRALRAPGTLIPRRYNTTTTTTTTTTQPPETTPLKSILIANRGEIALRVTRTAAHYGIRTTTLYTDPDKSSQHALSSPFALNLGSADQYLNGARIIRAARETGCDAIHPGYGFLSENAGFAAACADAGVRFIGPPAAAIEAMGDKARSKQIMTQAGVPCIPGYHGREQEAAELAARAAAIGFPVLLKAVKGGGGKGMRVARAAGEFRQQLESAKSEARSSFGDDVMLVEKYITTPRHIEVQVFADAHGNCVALGERDCSVQRRHQKILEESPAPNLDEAVRQELWEKARQAALAVGYRGAGTVEFIFDNDSGEFFFMEMNTRLQVEHPVSEMVTGEDLVRWQIIVAEGGVLPLTQEEIHNKIKARGHAIEARIYAEDPSMNFIPSTGKLLHLRTPPETESVRIDAGFVQGDEVSSHYDPMIAKLIVSGPDRKAALQKLRVALEQYEVAGPITNIEFLKRCCDSPAFVAGEVETGYIEKHRDELFAEHAPPPEVWAQAAIGLYELSQSSSSTTNTTTTTPALQTIGFGTAPQPRAFTLAETASDPAKTNPTTQVSVLKTSATTFAVTVSGATSDAEAIVFDSLPFSFDASTNKLTTYYPHTRLTSTLVPTPAMTANATTTHLTLFHRGALHRIHLATPSWAEKALGMKDTANSVLSPMPCKVLRVEVEAGQRVKKNQTLVVIESMKMETVIRAPADAEVARVVHGVGEVVGAGVGLVEFEEEGNE